MYSDKMIFVNGDFFRSFPSFHMLTAFLGTKVFENGLAPEWSFLKVLAFCFLVDRRK